MIPKGPGGQSGTHLVASGLRFDAGIQKVRLGTCVTAGGRGLHIRSSPNRSARERRVAKNRTAALDKLMLKALEKAEEAYLEAKRSGNMVDLDRGAGASLAHRVGRGPDATPGLGVVAVTVTVFYPTREAATRNEDPGSHIWTVARYRVLGAYT